METKTGQLIARFFRSGELSVVKKQIKLRLQERGYRYSHIKRAFIRVGKHEETRNVRT